MTPSDINQVLVTGRLTADPDLRVLASGRSRCLLSVEVRCRQRNPDSGNWAERVQFLDTVVFGGLGESCARELRAGVVVTIEGSLDLRGWENETGDCVPAVSIIVDIVQCVGAPGELSIERHSEEVGVRTAPEPVAATV